MSARKRMRCFVTDAGSKAEIHIGKDLILPTILRIYVNEKGEAVLNLSQGYIVIHPDSANQIRISSRE